MGQRDGQKISIDKIVALRSSVLPLYVIVGKDGNVTTDEEVKQGAFDFLTTFLHKDGTLSFRSYYGHFLSTADGKVTTKAYCSADEQFKVVMKDYQYAFQTRTGHFLSVTDREPFVTVSETCGDTELFQLFSLMMSGLNIGKQIEILERSGSVMIPDLIDQKQCTWYADHCRSDGRATKKGHEYRESELAMQSPVYSRLVAHPVLLQIAKRFMSPSLKLSGVVSTRTDADFVRKELEETTWDVVHPYSSLEWGEYSESSRLSLTAMWLMDDLTEANSTWASAPPGPRPPHLSNAAEAAEVIKNAQPLRGTKGSVWLYVGPRWISNTVGAAGFWKDYNAQTRYKYATGQIGEGSFRALADVTQNAPERVEMCPMVITATYIREYIRPAEDNDKRKTLPDSELDNKHKVEYMYLLADAR